MTNKIIAISLAALLSGCTTGVNTKERHAELAKQNGLRQIDKFIGSIKPHLESSLKSDPTGLAGMHMCATSAMELTKQHNASSKANIQVRRTAIKYRNPLNKPDAMDTQVMQQMVATKDMKPVVMKTDNGYRVYKPLGTMPACVVCHGDVSAMNKATVAKIKEFYPADLAVGFKPNDFRGVVVAEVRE